MFSDAGLTSDVLVLLNKLSHLQSQDAWQKVLLSMNSCTHLDFNTNSLAVTAIVM